ncbi:DsbA family protein [Devosia sp.]|jgi:protein-disulfide isomerase|uniref:DsbA family protein n=1 Tax=Devosia sp. TaxID=1871048 RepID=UPI001AD5D12A|nr:DsbA family protein [Devosia sp.]MBN9334089.1 DsbA family protein [Devosia sp.]
MNRLSVVLAAVAGILGGALGYSQFNQPVPETDTAAVRAIVEGMLSEREAAASAVPKAVAEIDPAVLNPMIESYLMSDPKLLQRLSVALDETLRVEEGAKAQVAITQMHDKIFNDPGQVVLGNPEGDVTLVEFFDYNCGYCRSALPDLATLLAEDPNLRVILKEFPILSNESIDAARVGVLVGQADVDYWTFHEALFSSRGKVDKAAALQAAGSLGLSPVDLELQMGEQRVAKTIQTSYEIAQALGISGTPTYIIGNEIIPGAIGVDDLRARIANMRACGETTCS